MKSLGKWIEKRNGVPGVPGTRDKRGTKGISGNPGHLLVGFYSTKEKTSQLVHIRDNFKFELKTNNLKVQVDLKSGEMIFTQIGNSVNDLEMESLLTSVFSIAIMHVMLQPRQVENKKIGDKYLKSIDMNEHYMLNSAVGTPDMLLAYNLAFAVNFDGCLNGGFDSGGGCGGIRFFFELILYIDFKFINIFIGCGGCGGNTIAFCIVYIPKRNLFLKILLTLLIY